MFSISCTDTNGITTTYPRAYPTMLAAQEALARHIRVATTLGLSSGIYRIVSITADTATQLSYA